MAGKVMAMRMATAIADNNQSFLAIFGWFFHVYIQIFFCHSRTYFVIPLKKGIQKYSMTS